MTSRSRAASSTSRSAAGMSGKDDSRTCPGRDLQRGRGSGGPRKTRSRDVIGSLRRYQAVGAPGLPARFGRGFSGRVAERHRRCATRIRTCDRVGAWTTDRANRWTSGVVSTAPVIHRARRRGRSARRRLVGTQFSQGLVRRMEDPHRCRPRRSCPLAILMSVSHDHAVNPSADAGRAQARRCRRLCVCR